MRNLKNTRREFVREVVFCDLLHATAHVFPVTLPRKLMAEKSELNFDKNLISRNHK